MKCFFEHLNFLFTRKIATLTFFIAFFTTVAFVFPGCQNDLISEPSLPQNSSSSQKNTFAAPTSITATHGGVKSVKIVWNASAGAASYNIYSAKTAYEEMQLCGETKTKSGELSIVIDEDAGSSRYYCVAAVDYSGELSGVSEKVLGSTLATPVITGILAGEDGTSSTVNWFMENCSEKTYQNNVDYEINCYLDSAGTNLVQSKFASGSQTSVTFTGLASNTNYFYKVRASVDFQKYEESDVLDAETAYKLIPGAAQEFTAAQGANRNCIELKFDLPEFSYYKATAGGYELHPVYFKIFRKLSDADDSEYEPIVTYLGTQPQSSDTRSDSVYVFSCSDSTGAELKDVKDDKNNTVVLIEENASAEITGSSTSAAYPDYIANTHIHFYDYTNLARGKQYSYKIQSYVDDCKNSVSSEISSVATSEGWLVAVPSFAVSSSYKGEKNNVGGGNFTSFSGLSVSFKADFEDFGKDYTYVLYESFIPFTISESKDITEGQEQFSVRTRTQTISDISNTRIEFSKEELSAKQGYYQYSLFVISSSLSAIPENPSEYESNESIYAWITQSGKITVTGDVNLLPSVNKFKVQDGWSNKFVLSWDYNENYSYSINWKDYKDFAENAEAVAEGSKTFEKSEISISIEGETESALYEHSAPSGVIRTYTITAISGLSATTEPTAKKCTLGIPKPKMEQIDYDTITVTWPEVVKPEEKNVIYELKAAYEDSSLNNDFKIEIDTAKITTENGQNSITIENPAGFNNPKVSGKPIAFSVTAKLSGSEYGEDSTFGSAIVRTLGPALVNTTITKDNVSANCITVTWNKIEGAKGYLINRIRHDKTGIPEKADTYYYDAENKTLYIGTGNTKIDYATVSIGSVFTLKDTALDNKTGDQSLDAYEDNQTKIAWGYEYSYTVLPVLNDSDFKFKGSVDKNNGDSENINGTLDNPKVAYTENLNYAHGATYGYGFDVAAEKSANGKTQNITWTKPYYSGFSPSLYRRIAGTSDEWENIDTRIDENVSKDTSFSYDPVGAERYTAYEYAIRYENVKNKSFVTSYVENLKSTLENRYKYADKEKTEQLNKGYLLAIDFSAKTGSGYDEEVIIADGGWNYDKRVIGPKSAALYITNYNLPVPRVKVADYNVENFEISAKETLKDTVLEEKGYTLALRPEAISTGKAGTTDGVLKVLRDAKHFYEIELASENGNAAEIQNKDGRVYAYRRITDEELVKAAMLNIAYAFYLENGGPEDLTDVEKKSYEYAANKTLTSSVTKGTATFSGRSLLGISEAGKYKAEVSLSDYTEKMLTPSGVYTTFISVSMSKVSTRTKGASDAYLDKFRTEGFTVTIKDLDSTGKSPGYGADIEVTCTGDSNLKVVKGGTTIIDVNKNKDTRRRWFPIQIGDDNNYWFKSVEYGWWLEN